MRSHNRDNLDKYSGRTRIYLKSVTHSPFNLINYLFCFSCNRCTWGCVWCNCGWCFRTCYMYRFSCYWWSDDCSTHIGSNRYNLQVLFLKKFFLIFFLFLSLSYIGWRCCFFTVRAECIVLQSRRREANYKSLIYFWLYQSQRYV